MARKSKKCKTMKRYMKRKTMNRKTMKRKTMKRKTMKRKTMKSSNKYFKRLKKIIKYGGTILEEELDGYSKDDLINEFIIKLLYIVNTFVVFYKNENGIDLYTVSFQYPPEHLLHKTQPFPQSKIMRYKQFDQLRINIQDFVKGTPDEDFYKTIFADKINARSDFWPKKHFDIRKSTKKKHINDREKKLTAFLRRMLHDVGSVDSDPEISDNVKNLIYDSIAPGANEVAESTWKARIKTNSESDIYARKYLEPAAAAESV